MILTAIQMAVLLCRTTWKNKHDAPQLNTSNATPLCRVEGII